MARGTKYVHNSNCAVIKGNSGLVDLTLKLADARAQLPEEGLVSQDAWE